MDVGKGIKELAAPEKGGYILRLPILEQGPVGGQAGPLYRRSRLYLQPDNPVAFLETLDII
jgi:hypothetical protein